MPKIGLKERNPAKALRILEPELQKPNLNSYLIAIECCAKLKDISKGERIFERGLKFGLNKTMLKVKLLEMYFINKRYDLVLELYEELKREIIQQSTFYTIMIRFFGERDNLEEAKKIFEMAKKNLLNPRDLEFIELDFFRIFVRNLNPGKILNFYLENKDNLNNLQLKILLGTLYEKNAYRIILDIYEDLPESKKEYKPLRKIMLYALLKVNKVKTIDLLRRIIDNESNPEEYQILLANALAGNRQTLEAQRLFELILLNINIKSPNYGSALVGYIFTNPELTKSEISKFKEDLKFLIRHERGPRLLKDLKNALELLSGLKL